MLAAYIIGSMDHWPQLMQVKAKYIIYQAPALAGTKWCIYLASGIFIQSFVHFEVYKAAHGIVGYSYQLRQARVTL